MKKIMKFIKKANQKQINGEEKEDLVMPELNKEAINKIKNK